MAKVPQEPISGFGLGVWTDGDVAAGPDVQIKCHCGPNFKFFKRPPSKRPFAQSLLRKIAFLPEKPRMPSFFLPQPKSAPFSARPIAASAVLCASSAISQYFLVLSSYTRTTEHTYLSGKGGRTAKVEVEPPVPPSVRPSATSSSMLCVAAIERRRRPNAIFKWGLSRIHPSSQSELGGCVAAAAKEGRKGGRQGERERRKERRRRKRK